MGKSMYRNGARCVQGFLLIELLISVLVFSILAMVIGHYHMSAIYWLQESYNVHTALQKATSFLEHGMNYPDIFMQKSELRDGVFVIKWSLHPITHKEMISVMLPIYNTQEIHVEVSWEDAMHYLRTIHINSIVTFEKK